MENGKLVTPTSEALNLVRELREYGDNALHKITMHGLRCLFDAVESARSEKPSAITEVVGADGKGVSAPCAIDGCALFQGRATLVHPADKNLPTPRTDAVHKRIAAYSSWKRALEELLDHARQLERELADSQDGPDGKPRSATPAIHPALQGEWTPRRCMYLVEATLIDELCKLLNGLQAGPDSRGVPNG